MTVRLAATTADETVLPSSQAVRNKSFFSRVSPPVTEVVCVFLLFGGFEAVDGGVVMTAVLLTSF